MTQFSLRNLIFSALPFAAAILTRSRTHACTRIRFAGRFTLARWPTIRVAVDVVAVPRVLVGIGGDLCTCYGWLVSASISIKLVARLAFVHVTCTANRIRFRCRAKFAIHGGRFHGLSRSCGGMRALRTPCCVAQIEIRPCRCAALMALHVCNLHRTHIQMKPNGKCLYICDGECCRRRRADAVVA